jgi:hypothetical protein
VHVCTQGNIKCEICGQQYKGQYTVPPPPPPPPAPVLNSQMFIVDPSNPSRMIPTNTAQVRARQGCTSRSDSDEQGFRRAESRWVLGGGIGDPMSGGDLFVEKV